MTDTNSLRPLILGSILCIALAVGGCFVIQSAGFHADWAGALTALGAGIGALILATLPLRLLRGLSQVAMMQAGLAGTVIHLLVLLMSAAIVIFCKLPVGSTFIFWLMGIYVITLIALVTSIARVFRAAETASTSTHA